MNKLPDSFLVFQFKESNYAFDGKKIKDLPLFIQSLLSENKIDRFYWSSDVLEIIALDVYGKEHRTGLYCSGK